jgi:hypothetical protein
MNQQLESARRSPVLADTFRALPRAQRGGQCSVLAPVRGEHCTPCSLPIQRLVPTPRGTQGEGNTSSRSCRLLFVDREGRNGWRAHPRKVRQP